MQMRQLGRRILIVVVAVIVAVNVAARIYLHVHG